MEHVGLVVFGRAGFVVPGIALIITTLRHSRKLGLLPRLALFDLVLLVPVLAYLGRQIYEFVYYFSQSPTPLPISWYVNWLMDPLLGLLLIIAILLRRASQSLKGGLIERCWTCYVMGIFLTTVANAGGWAFNNGLIHWPYSAVTWYLWFLPAAAFAMGPAYQVAAILQAKSSALE